MPHLSTITWTPFDQMKFADKGGGGIVYFTYGADGQRVRKVWEKTGTLKDERIYLGSYEIYREKTSGVTQLERQTLHVMDGAKRIAMVETKTIGGGTPLVDMMRYQLGNHLGSAVLEVNEAGLIISYEEYSPYGSSAYRSSRSGVEVSAKRYRYVGLECDDETGLYSMGARYYAAWLGRWTSADPMGIGADGPGLYNYTRGSPVVYIDPGGMLPNLFEVAQAGIQEARNRGIDPRSVGIADVPRMFGGPEGEEPADDEGSDESAEAQSDGESDVATEPEEPGFFAGFFSINNKRLGFVSGAVRGAVPLGQIVPFMGTGNKDFDTGVGIGEVFAGTAQVVASMTVVRASGFTAGPPGLAVSNLAGLALAAEGATDVLAGAWHILQASKLPDAPGGSSAPAAATPPKPKRSPDVTTWTTKKGGSVEVKDGVWIYTNKAGQSVSYPGGFPDFKAAGFVKQEVKLTDGFQGYTKDFAAADAQAVAAGKPRSATSTWHHHEDGVTMQEIDAGIHAQFTHMGGMAGRK